MKISLMLILLLFTIGCNYSSMKFVSHARNGNKEKVESFIKDRTALEVDDAKDDFGNTALYAAAKNGNGEIVKLLLDKGCDPNKRVGYKKSNKYPIVAAIGQTKNKKTVMKLLLEAGAQLGPVFKPIIASCDTNNFGSYIKISDDSLVQVRDSLGRTLLHNAVANNCNAFVTFLLDRKADINCKDKFGSTPLQLAIKKNKIAMVDNLLKQNADPNIRDNRGRNSLHYAAQLKKTDITSKLLSIGVDCNIKDTSGNNPLNYATYDCNSKVVSLLLDNGSKILGKSEDIENNTLYKVFSNPEKANGIFIDSIKTNCFNIIMDKMAFADFLWETPLDTLNYAQINYLAAKYYLKKGKIDKANSCRLRAGKYFSYYIPVINKQLAELERLRKKAAGKNVGRIFLAALATAASQTSASYNAYSSGKSYYTYTKYSPVYINKAPINRQIGWYSKQLAICVNISSQFSKPYTQSEIDSVYALHGNPVNEVAEPVVTTDKNSEEVKEVNTNSDSLNVNNESIHKTEEAISESVESDTVINNEEDLKSAEVSETLIKEEVSISDSVSSTPNKDYSVNDRVIITLSSGATFDGVIFKCNDEEVVLDRLGKKVTFSKEIIKSVKVVKKSALKGQTADSLKTM